MSLKSQFSDALDKYLFSKATIVSKEVINDSFTYFEIQSDEFKKCTYRVGDCVRISFGELQVRSYTALTWNVDKGVVSFVIYMHGAGMGPIGQEMQKFGTNTYF